MGKERNVYPAEREGGRSLGERVRGRDSGREGERERGREGERERGREGKRESLRRLVVGLGGGGEGLRLLSRVALG